MNAIISASELASDLAGPNPPVLLDVRWQLSVAKAAGEPPFDGRAEYAAGHIPGAVYVDLDSELAAAAGTGGRHPLPDLAEFGAAMRRAGVSAGHAGGRVRRRTGLGGGPRVVAAALDGSPGRAGPRRRVAGLGGDAGDTGAGRRPRATSSRCRALRGCSTPTGRPRWRAPECCWTRGRGSGTGVRWSRSTGSAGTSRARCPRPPRRTSARTAASCPRRSWPTASSPLAPADGSRVGVYCGSGVSGAHEVLALAVAGIPAALYVGLVVGVVVGPVAPGGRRARTRSSRARRRKGPRSQQRGPSPYERLLVLTTGHSCFFRRVPNTISSQLGTAARRPGRTPSASAWRSVAPMRRSRWLATERGIRTSA